MPIYAYRCDACGHAKDVLQKMSDPLLISCPACGAESFKKQVTAAGFQLKGSGWYVTDFRGSAPGATPAETTSVAAKPSGDVSAAKESGASAGAAVASSAASGGTATTAATTSSGAASAAPSSSSST